MRELALFAGAGGGILGGILSGFRTVCAVEINSFCREVLLRRQLDGCLPRFPIWDDIRTFDGRPWRGFVDIVTGGFPCQAFSSAAHGRNTARDLWPEMLKIIGEICPIYIMAENVSEAAIGTAQTDLEECGYKTIRASISASDLGADHIRKRLWLLAYSDDESKLALQIDAKMDRLQECSYRIWGRNPGKSGVDDWLAFRMDRFQAIGNGQVPAVAALAWKILR